MKSQRYKILISYDGTCFAGWQVQANSSAIQPLIQKAIETILRHSISLAGSGRTDAGVHATGQVAHFDSDVSFNPHGFLVSLNALLPNEIRVHSIEQVSLNFHARYSATSKVYHYHLRFDPISDPFTHLYYHHVFEKCDLDRLSQAKQFLLGTHDFSSFTNKQHVGIAARNATRTLLRIDLVPIAGGVRLEFEANGFLYKMVRNITGTLLDVAAGRIPPNQIKTILSSKDRKKAGNTAPATGLFLRRVKYPLETENDMIL